MSRRSVGTPTLKLSAVLIKIFVTVLCERNPLDTFFPKEYNFVVVQEY